MVSGPLGMGFRKSDAEQRDDAEKALAEARAAQVEGLTTAAKQEDKGTGFFGRIGGWLSSIVNELGFGFGWGSRENYNDVLRPMYDALYEMIGFDRVARLIERNIIEIAPLAFMRGRTLNHAFIILDEAQNTTPEQMKMFLTRIGFGAKAVVTGDVTQIDLARGQKSGLIEARRILSDVRGIAFTQFGANDVVRHPLVARIIDAYEKHSQGEETPPPK